jgi:hypothetical protein
MEISCHLSPRLWIDIANTFSGHLVKFRWTVAKCLELDSEFPWGDAIRNLAEFGPSLRKRGSLIIDVGAVFHFMRPYILLVILISLNMESKELNLSLIAIGGQV